jgi:hypothetical protein
MARGILTYYHLVKSTLKRTLFYVKDGLELFKKMNGVVNNVAACSTESPITTTTSMQN